MHPYATNNELSHMYDWTFAKRRLQIQLGGYRDDPYKHFIRKQGDPGRAVHLDASGVWQVRCALYEDSAALSWGSTATYHFRVEWEPSRRGQTWLRIYRDGALVLATSPVRALTRPAAGACASAPATGTRARTPPSGRSTATSGCTTALA